MGIGQNKQRNVTKNKYKKHMWVQRNTFANTLQNKAEQQDNKS